MRLHLALLAAVGLSTAVGAPTDALACGGFFCSNSPVNQSAERVVFVRHAEGDTTAVVQVQANGSDPNFAWVVPLDALPTNIREEAATGLTAMDFSTAPQYIFSQRFTGYGSSGGGFGCGAADSAGVPSAANDDERAVRVWATGEVGNFHYDVVSSEDGNALFTWLNDHSYQTPDAARPIVGEYVSEHKYFLAFRLHSPQGTPSFLVTPIAFDYPGLRPCVPIRLTRIATAPTLPVLVFVIGESRATPMNFVNTEVADRAVAALGPAGFSSNAYDTLVTRAVDDAGGRAWVTEFAGPLDASITQSLSPTLRSRLPIRPYLTRLYTTLSAARMDRDPEFVFTAGLPTVSNVHDLSRFSSANLLDARLLLAGSGLLGLARSIRRRLARRAQS